MEAFGYITQAGPYIMEAISAADLLVFYLTLDVVDIQGHPRAL